MVLHRHGRWDNFLNLRSDCPGESCVSLARCGQSHVLGINRFIKINQTGLKRCSSTYPTAWLLSYLPPTWRNCATRSPPTRPARGKSCGGKAWPRPPFAVTPRGWRSCHWYVGSFGQLRWVFARPPSYTIRLVSACIVDQEGKSLSPGRSPERLRRTPFPTGDHPRNTPVRGQRAACKYNLHPREPRVVFCLTRRSAWPRQR